MKITVELFGKYREHFKEKRIQLELSPKDTISRAIEKLKIEDSIDLWVLRNGVPVKKDEILKDGDTIFLFQPVGGG